MLRSKPKLKYSGLTVIMSNPSRFDTVSLLSSTGGELFNGWCLRPDFNLMQVDVRLTEDRSPFIEGTRCIMTLGELATKTWIPQTRQNSIHEVRGGLYDIQGIPTIPSYLPQDAADLKNYEAEHNEHAGDFDDEEREDADGDSGDLKGMQKTKRKNYAFWLKSDTKKAKRVLRGEWAIEDKQRISPVYVIMASTREVVDALHSRKDNYFYFDIETDYEDQNLLCFAFSFDGRTIWSVPILDYRYYYAYPEVPSIMRALATCISRNILIAHNGAAFDCLVMGLKYHIPSVRVYDTMLAHQRCFPSIEKSLGHCISFWTWENFHKDEDSKAYYTSTDMHNKLKYCAKDVYGMYLVHKAIESYSKTIPGLTSSIECVMDSIVPYLTTTFQGIQYDPKKIDKIVSENDRLMMEYDRCIRVLIGKTGLELVQQCIQSKHKGLFAGSSKQCAEYFHKILGYPVLFRSPDTGEPSVGKKTLYKLALKYPENAVIHFVNAYRRLQKESGSLRFNPWKGDDGKVLPRIKMKD